MLGVKLVVGGEVEERGVDLFKIPGIGNGDGPRAHGGMWREQPDIFRYLFRHPPILGLVEELKPVDGEVGLLAKPDRRAPFA
ncbi:hypothetical protein D3C76_1211820 [compost metagenome]